MKTIDGHTIDERLLTEGAVIDIGCRGFVFADYFKPRHNVYCIDPDKLQAPQGVFYDQCAITGYEGETVYYKLGEAGYTKDIKEFNPDESTTVRAMQLQTFINKRRIMHIDILKLDCEGAEYTILTDKFCNHAKQITVEFHEHAFPELHKEMYPRVLANLSRWYDLVYQRPDAPLMDCLFVRR